jgi:broad specificity phosphatase PhoE
VTRFFLVRHGEVALNRELRYVGAQDEALTEIGREQARQLSEALRPFRLDAVYSSPLQRARVTAEQIAAPHGLPVITDDGLRESAFGAWEGMSRAEVAIRYPDLLLAWEQDPHLSPPDGESLVDLQQRVEACAERLVAIHPHSTLVLVSHAGPIKALLCATLGASPAAIRRMFIDPATISVVDWLPGGRVLRLFNSHAHLGWETARWMGSAS